jgi:hypothetical protein
LDLPFLRVLHAIRINKDDLSLETNTAPPDWDGLLKAVRSTKPGTEEANVYHRRVEELLAALFYPSLTSPQHELEMHGGLKRIDITFTNEAKDGFFSWLSKNYPAAFVFVECKNYTKDIANPELDQMAGRFSPSRGKFGIIVCRTFKNKEVFIKRCRKTADDKRGFVVPLDDNDLAALVDEAKNAGKPAAFGLLMDRFGY